MVFVCVPNSRADAVDQLLIIFIFLDHEPIIGLSKKLWLSRHCQGQSVDNSSIDYRECNYQSMVFVCVPNSRADAVDQLLIIFIFLDHEPIIGGDVGSCRIPDIFFHLKPNAFSISWVYTWDNLIVSRVSMLIYGDYSMLWVTYSYWHS